MGVPFPKIVINLLWALKKVYCKGELYLFSGIAFPTNIQKDTIYPGNLNKVLYCLKFQYFYLLKCTINNFTQIAGWCQSTQMQYTKTMQCNKKLWCFPFQVLLKHRNPRSLFFNTNLAFYNYF